jgi:hypothetical protein
MPYSQRPQVSMVAAPAERLDAVLDRAASGLGYELARPSGDGGEDKAEWWPTRPVDAIDFVAFYDGTDVARPVPLLTVLDADGHAVWNQSWRSVTIQELLAASSAGLVAGDVLRPYFVPQESAGAFDGVDWDGALELLQHVPLWLSALAHATEDVLNLAKLYGVVYLGVSKAHLKWQQRNGGPLDVTHLAKSPVRSTVDLARLLDVSEDVAAAIQTLVGADPGVPASGGDASAAELTQAVWMVLEAALTSGLTDAAIYPRELLHEAAMSALTYVSQGGRDERELRAIFGRQINPNWDRLNSDGWEPPE